MIYILNLFLVFLYFFIIKVRCKGELKQNYLFAIVVTVHALLFRVLAYPFDYADTLGYANAYMDISDYSFKEVAFSFHEYTVWGQGYAVINWLLSRISTDIMFFFIVIGIFITGGALWFYKKTSYSLLLTVFLYFLYPMLYLMGFAVLRQHIAAVIILFALFYVNNYKISIPLALVAPLVHISAVVFLPFFIWRKIDFSKMNPIKLIICLVLGIIVLRAIVGIAIGFISNILVTNRNEDFASQGDNSNIMPVIILGSMTIIIFKENILKKCKGIDYEIILFLIYGFLISIFGVGLSGAGRLSLFFIYIVPVAVSYLIHYSIEYRPLNIIYIFFLCLVFIRQIYYMHSSWVLDYDYKFFWNYL